jgi:glycerophosphoryl diester phosphodiesterase
MKKLIIIVLSTGFFFACNPDLEVLVPDFGNNSILEDTNPLPLETRPKMDGIYRVIEGSGEFGSQVVVKWSGDYMSIFSEKNAAYFVLQGGFLESVLFFEGYWRFATNTETGLAQFKISGENGGDYLLNDGENVPIELSGTFGSNGDFPSRTIKLLYDRPFSEKVFARKFYILAHRGGGRTSDLLPASENTPEMLALAGRYGANAVEIDVKLSADRISFLYHDATINLRLTQKGPVWGNIEDFTFAQLATFVTLVNGEKIPSLRQALEYILEETTIELVWLDMKSDKNDFPEVLPLVQEITGRAETMGRQLELLVGLPTDDKISQFQAAGGPEKVLSICELEVEDVRRTDSEVWGPRWTLGTQDAAVDQMHAEGRRVITWTMDDPVYINKYIREAGFDGMVTNYPTLVAYYWHIQ